MSGQKIKQGELCGCCEPTAPITPQEIYNRPGLSAIEYRVGTFASFRQAMFNLLSGMEIEIDGQKLRPLQSFTARNSDDFGIAFVEMWSYLGDILTFYQERIANEAYLNTAQLQESILRIAALLDYKPLPGVAAATHLAFFLDKNKTVEVPVGLLVQSVPGQDEKAQKFETVESFSAVSELNEVKIYPLPQTTTLPPFHQNAEQAVLNPAKAAEIAANLSVGDAFVIFNLNLNGSEEKEVDSVIEENGHTVLKWKPAVKESKWTAASRAFRFERKFRFFGHNAPAQYMQAVSTSSGVEWNLVQRSDPDFDVSPTSPFLLDTTYEDIKSGGRLLLAAPGQPPVLLTITAVEQDQAEFEPLTGAVTKISFTASGSFSAFDRRKAVLYELSEPEIQAWDYQYAEALQGNVFSIQTENLKAGILAKGRKVILTDGEETSQVVTIDTVFDAIDFDGDGIADHLKFQFSPALSDSMKSSLAKLYGNVAKATHGETIENEVLGSGDASSEFQKFLLKKKPVTFISDPHAPNGAANTLEIRVDNILWHEAPTFFNRQADERIFTTEIDEEGEMAVRFGDGKTGARLTTGRNNVTGAYRHGSGPEGNVNSKQITTLLDRPVGLKSVRNPAPALGGTAAESVEQTRRNAPNTVRTFGRIVSLRDFEDAAREFAGVAKARAAWKWDGEEQSVLLTVAGDNGAAIIGETYQNLVDFLDDRRDTNRKMQVIDHTPVYLHIEAAVKLAPDYIPETVLSDAKDILLEYFSFENQSLGKPVHLSDIYAILQQVEGIVAVELNQFQYKYDADRLAHKVSVNPLQSHLPIFSGELAAIETADDIEITAGMQNCK